MNRTTKIIFTLSILLNLLLGGMALGHHYRKMNWSAQFEEGLSPEGAKVVRDTFATGREDFMVMMREMKDAKEALMRAVKAPTFDEAAFDQASDAMKASVTKMTERRFATLKTIMVILPQQDKVPFADKFIRLIQGMGKAKPRGKGGPEKYGQGRHDYQAERVKNVIKDQFDGAQPPAEAQPDREGEGVPPPVE